jgi:hypothetical protein
MNACDDWSWDYDICDTEGCGELATHRLYIGDELRRHVCEPHHFELAAEHDWFWHDVGLVVAAAGELDEVRVPPAG